MDLVHEWLATTIETELGAVLQWRDSASHRSETWAKVGDLTFEDDGSNLRVVSRQSGGILQIIKFPNYGEPVIATLSDSTTRINATFEASAVARYTTATRRPLTTCIVGGLIQLLEFEIVATHLGPRPDRLKLLVKEFKILGSTGSGTKGIPRGADQIPRLRLMLDKLSKQRTGNEITSPSSTRQSSPRTPSLQSHAGSNIAGEDTPGKNESTFATQVPYGMPDTRNRKRKASDSTSIASTSTTSLNSARTQLQMRAQNDQKTNRGTSSLLDILAGKNISTTHASLKSSANIPTINPQRYQDVTSKQTKDPSIEVPNRPIRTGISSPEASPCSIDKQNPPLLPVTERSSTIASKPRNRSENRHPLRSTQDQVASPLNHSQKFKRIRGHDVKISKEQAALLDSEDSWIPAEPGHRVPVANLPISVLKTLNKQADQSARRKQSAKDDSTKTNAPLSPIDHESDYHKPNSGQLDDAPLSSAEWPPTPMHDQLPPDSPAQSSKKGVKSLLPVSLDSQQPFSQVSNISSPRQSKTKSTQDPYTPDQNMQISPRELPQTFSSNFCEEGNGESPHTKCKEFENWNDRQSPGCKGGDHNSEAHAHEMKAGAEESSPGLNTSQFLTANQDLIQSETERSCKTNGTSENVLRANSSPPSPIRLTKAKAESLRRLTQSKHLSHSKKDSAARCSSGSSNSDSELEMTVPVALGDIATSIDNDLSSQLHPSTAPQSDQPFTQVERTPYVSGYVKSGALRKQKLDEISSSKESDPVATMAHMAGHKRTPLSPEIEVSCSDPKKAHRGQASFPSESTKDLNESKGNGEQGMLHREGFVDLSQQNHGSKRILKENPELSPASFQKADSERDSASLSEDPKPQAEPSDASKRRRPQSESSNTREKKRPQILDLLQDKPSPDPSVLARQHRQEWFSGRRSSERSTPKASPNSPPQSGFLFPAANTPVKIYEDQIKTSKSHPILESVPENRPPNALRRNTSVLNTPMQITTSFENPDSGYVFPGAPDEITEKGNGPSQYTHPSSSVAKARPHSTAVGLGISTGTFAARSIPAETFPSLSDLPKSISVNQHAGNLQPEAQRLQNSLTIFDRFKATYPDYPGDIKHFSALCKKIKTLLEADRMEHPSLWDDFIIRHKLEYAKYIQSCADEVEDPLSYEKFYRNSIEEPQYISRIIVPRTLPEALFVGVQRSTYEFGQNITSGSAVGKATSDSVIQATGTNQFIDLTQEGDSLERPPDSKRTFKVPRIKARGASQRSLPWNQLNGGLRDLGHSHSLPTATNQPSVQPVTSMSGENSVEAVHGSRVSTFLPFAPARSGSPISFDTQSVKTPASHAWWQDNDSPYRTFARAYASIRPGHGNSFAKVESRAKGEHASRAKNDVDVLSWTLK